MEKTLRSCADQIVEASIRAVLPDEAVRRALKDFHPEGRTVLVAAGKAAWQMAHAAVAVLGHVDGGVVVTKYNHVKGKIPGVTCCEAGHPVPDANSFASTQKALELVQGLQPEDTVLFLLSGGGSALFEKPLIPAEELQDITSQLLASGADIVEMNTIRKRLSGVKGGRFAQACAPAQVFSIVLSDILGDPLDMIASGPAVPDTSTCGQAIAIAEKYHLRLSTTAQELLRQETPKALTNVTTRITGSVRELCTAAAAACRALGYEPVLLTDRLCCEAREAGSFLGSVVRTHAGGGRKLAYIAGGETVVHLTGKGLGGRNQELALAAAPALAGLKSCWVLPWAPVRPAAMWTARRKPPFALPGGTCTAPSPTTTPTMLCRRWAGSFAQALPARTSTMWPWRWWSEHRGHAWFRRGSSGRSARSFGLQRM